MTTSPRGGDVRPPFQWQFAGALAAIVLLTHLAVNVWTPYGVHRDEFLYLAMGEHLRLFRMDFPPAIALIALAERGVLGDSLLAIRFVPALGDAALIVLAAAMARELGGGRFAQALAAIAVALHPLFLRPGNLFQPVFLDQLCWTSALFALARFERTRDPRWWYVIGAIGGLGLLTKFSILFIGFALLIALLLDDRPALRTRGPWLALAIALAIGSPSVIGQIRLGYPVVAQMTTLRASQLAHVSVGSFLRWQLLFGPSCVLAAAGVLWLLLATAARPVRILGISCAAVFVTLLLLRGKPYYVGPVYPTLLAAGTVWLERIGRSFGAQVARAGAVAAIVLYDAFLLPLALPALPPPMMARYAAASGISEAVRTNRGTVLRLPQDFADMLGWPERVALVAHVFDSLPPAKRAQTVLVGENYGEAGALEFYGPRYHLPAAVSAAGSYWFFGPGEKPGDVLITLGVSREDLARLYDVVTPAAHLRNDWTVEEEQDLTVYVCERPRRTLQSIWPELAGRN
jgi:hypothetical protein